MTPMVTAEHVLEICRAQGQGGSFSVSEYANARARAQQLSPADIRHVLTEATRCELDGARWMVEGPSLDGKSVTIFVIIHDGALSVV